MNSSRFTILSSLPLLAGIVGLWVWRSMPEPKGLPNGLPEVTTPNHRTPRPGMNTADFEELLRPLAGDRLSMALGIADRITRERIQLTDSQTSEMMNVVRDGKPADMENGEWHHWVNSILNALREQENEPDGFVDLLLETASQRDDQVLGLYALQHLSMWLPKETNPEKRQAIQNLFIELMRTPGEPMAGTAVLMSSDLERQRVDGFDPSHIEGAAMRLVADKEAPQDVRVSALHACTDRQLVAVLEDARNIAADRGEVSTLRKAAIHAIGRMGGESDLPLLEELSKEGRHIAAAATPATQRITQRIHHP